MSIVKVLGNDVSLAAVAAQAAVTTLTTPFLPGRSVTAVINFAGVTGAPTVTLQTSDDGAAWVDVLTVAGIKPNVHANVTLKKQVRLNVTVAGTAGTCSAYLHGVQ